MLAQGTTTFECKSGYGLTVPDEARSVSIAAEFTPEVTYLGAVHGTLAALKHFREKLFNPAVVAHNGRIVKLIGDGTLVDFASVVDAVECAVAVQNAVAGRVLPPGALAIQLRIGVNLGDVIIDGDDI